MIQLYVKQPNSTRYREATPGEILAGACQMLDSNDLREISNQIVVGLMNRLTYLPPLDASELAVPPREEDE